MNITATHPEYNRSVRLYRIIDDVLLGEEHIKSLGVRYLPMTCGMKALQSSLHDGSMNVTEDNIRTLYADLLERSQFPSWSEDALLVMVGLVAQLQPIIALPPNLKYLEETATSDGFSLTELFQRVCYHLIRYSKCTLVADIDDFKKGYISLYDAYAEYNWSIASVGGRTDLEMVAFKEMVKSNPDDKFDHTLEENYRAYIIQDDKAQVILKNNSSTSDSGYTVFADHLGMPDRPLKYLPVVRLSAINNISEISNPPLLPLVRATLKAYSLSADLYSALHRCCHPQMYVTGVSSSPLDTNKKQGSLNYTGAGTLWTLPLNSVVGYAEPTGTGMAKVADEITKQKSSALEAGAKVMDIGVESGDAREARQNDQYATLYSIIKNAAKAIEQVIRYIFDMTNPTEDKETELSIRFEIPSDFGRHKIESTVAAHLMSAAERGAVSFDTYWMYLTTGKMPERTLAEEINKMSSETIKLKPITGMVQQPVKGDPEE